MENRITMNGFAFELFFKSFEAKYSRQFSRNLIIISTIWNSSSSNADYLKKRQIVISNPISHNWKRAIWAIGPAQQRYFIRNKIETCNFQLNLRLFAQINAMLRYTWVYLLKNRSKLLNKLEEKTSKEKVEFIFDIIRKLFSTWKETKKTDATFLNWKTN